MNRWLALVLVILLVVPAAAFGQGNPRNWNQSHDPYNAAIGLAAGLTSGSGLAVRWPALPQTMVSVAGGVWGGGDSLAWNIGTEAHFVLRQAGKMRFLTGPAVAVYSDDEDKHADVNISVGIGLEYLFRQRISVKFDVGFTYLGDDEKVYPLPQAALFFYF